MDRQAFESMILKQMQQHDVVTVSPIILEQAYPSPRRISMEEVPALIEKGYQSVPVPDESVEEPIVAFRGFVERQGWTMKYSAIEYQYVLRPSEEYVARNRLYTDRLKGLVSLLVAFHALGDRWFRWSEVKSPEDTFVEPVLSLMSPKNVPLRIDGRGWFAIDPDEDIDLDAVLARGVNLPTDYARYDGMAFTVLRTLTSHGWDVRVQMSGESGQQCSVYLVKTRRSNAPYLPNPPFGKRTGRDFPLMACLAVLDALGIPEPTPRAMP